MLRATHIALLAASVTVLVLCAPGAASALPPIKHVFIVVLENENQSTSFGPGSKAPYLAHTLRSSGQYLPNYYGTGHLSLGNYITMVSGQPSNPITQADAPAFTPVVPGTVGPDGIAIGQGSVYPATVKTIGDQLRAKGLTWRGYMEDMGNSATAPKTCRHPGIGMPDQTQSARQGDQYATRHNPFVYFQSITDDQAYCDANDVPLDRLQADLSSAATTPNYAFITPNLCHDGHDEPCKGSNEPGGLVSADAFLKQWVPRITSSPAYKDGGLLLVTFDEAEAQGSGADSSACCNEQPGPNTPSPGGPTPGPGGGKVGAVLLSPYIAAGGLNSTPYNHYSLLRSTEDVFALSHLALAGQSGLRAFGADVFTNPGGHPGDAGKPPRIRVRGVPHRCITHSFKVRIRVKAKGLKRVTVKIDKRRVRSTGHAKLRLTVSAHHVKPGKHHVRVTAADSAQRHVTRSVAFKRCSSS